MKHVLPAFLFILRSVDAGVGRLAGLLDRHDSLSFVCNLLVCFGMFSRAVANLPGNPIVGWMYFMVAVLTFGFASVDGINLLLAGVKLVRRLRQQARRRRVDALIRYFTPLAH